MKTYFVLLYCILCVSCNFGGSKAPVPPQKAPNTSQIVEETNAIINEIKAPLDGFGAFLQSRNDPKTARLIMLGENHANERGLKDSLRALLFLAKKSDVVLIEGNDPIKHGQQDCDYLIFRIYALQKWNQLNQPFDHIEFSKFQDTLFSPWYKAKSTFALSTLKLSELICDFWDDRAAFALSPLLASAVKRNDSMAAQIEKYIKEHRVFVIAGLRHLPMGELHAFKEMLRNDPAKRSWYQLTPDTLEALKLEDFYRVLDQEALNPKAQLLRASEAFGSTFKLNSVLKASSGSELIPAYLVN